MVNPVQEPHPQSMARFARFAGCVVSACLAAACGPADIGPSATSRDAGAPSSTAPPLDGSVAQGDAAGGRCGEQDFALVRGQAPDMLIVLDRSGSMGLVDSGQTSRWDQLIPALESTVMAEQANI